jgi:hypothetical protein
MSTIRTLSTTGWVSVLVGLGAAACSKPMQHGRDASVDPGHDGTDGVVAPAADVATDLEDVAADGIVTKDAPALADAVAMSDIYVPADLSPTRDAPPPDLAKDALAAEIAGDVATAEVVDGHRDGAAAPDTPPALGDGGTGVPAACTPGMDQTCNDSSLVSSVWGTCAADGTCVCHPGYILNPSTGRCTTGLRDAGIYGDSPAACTGAFEACGCGCCGGTSPTPVCYYPALGETTALFQAKDEEVRQTTNCLAAGCSRGQRYVCCVADAPEPAGSATYAADAYVGDLDHLNIQKVGADCAQLSLAAPAVDRDDRIALQTNGNWGMARARFGGCGDGAAAEMAQGVLGTLVVRKGALGCVVDVHASLFAHGSTGEVRTTRLDADNLPIGGMGDDLCRW